MNKTFFILSLCLISLTSFAQEISKTYSFSDPKIINKENYCMVEFENTLQSATIGNPMLPYFAAQILLPPGCEAKDVTFEFGEQKEIAINNQLFPKQPVRPYSLSTPFQFNKNEETYSSTNYPEKANGVLTTNFYRGHAIANVCFTPVVYNPAENQVSFYSTVTVKVSYETSEKATNALRFLKKTDNIEKKVQNTEMINKYENLISESKSDDYDVLILSSAIFETAFEELRVLHTNYGLISKFKDLSEIYSEMDGSDNPEKIRNYIIQEYENHSIEYVLLGGDVEILPYRGFYCHVQSSSPYIDNDIPSDLYYSALDGNWNDNNNSLWGEIGEDDLEPEVSVSRMSFSNLNELNAMIHKTVSYQTDPVLGELNKPLLLGEHLYYGPLTWGADYLDLLVGEHNDNGYYTKGIPETDPYDSLYDRGAASQWTSTQLINRMNEGASFIYHAGHSDWNYMMRLSNYHITTTNFPKLDGITHNYTFVYSHGCICGAFDENDCIAEKMTTNQNILVGGVFNSRYGWFNEGQTEGPSGHLNREFVDALYTDEYNRLGRAHKESKIATSPWVNAPGQWEEGALRWCFYCSNALGDPALAIWRDEPYNVEVSCLMEFDPDATSFDVTVTINNEAASGTSCVMMNGDEFLGRAVTDETGFCVIEFIKELPNVENIQLYVNNYNTLLTKTVITFPNWVGINNHSNNESLNVYPNPADNSIFVEISEKDNENLMIEILNISGQVVITQKIKSQNIIDISSLSSGAYFVRYGDSTTKFVKK